MKTINETPIRTGMTNSNRLMMNLDSRIRTTPQPAQSYIKPFIIAQGDTSEPVDVNAYTKRYHIFYG
jgi:hypothetical protein